MSILYDFFIAEGLGVPTYNAGASIAPGDRCQLERITPLQAGELLAVLREDGDGLDLMDEFILLTEEEADEWTQALPDDMMTILSQLSDDQVNVKAQLFAEATQEELGWSAENVEPVLFDLRQLAQRGLDAGKKMYLWNSL